jgi:hypothetical protein
MYKHHISAMVEELTAASMLSDRAAAENIFNTYWQDKIALVWTTDDVRAALTGDMDFDNEQKDENWEDCITEDEAIEALQSVLKHHDCSYGVTWETIHDAATDAIRIRLPIKG